MSARDEQIEAFLALEGLQEAARTRFAEDGYRTVIYRAADAERPGFYWRSLNEADLVVVEEIDELTLERTYRVTKDRFAPERIVDESFAAMAQLASTP